MEIKKHVFDVLSPDDLNRAIHGCLIRLPSGTIAQVLECYTNSRGNLGVRAVQLLQDPTSDYGWQSVREFTLGRVQIEACLDPESLLPTIRSGLVNVPTRNGNLVYDIRRRVGGYVRGYGGRTIDARQAVISSGHVGLLSPASNSINIVGAVVAAFSGGNYLTPSAAVAKLAQGVDYVIALSKHVTLTRYQDGYILSVPASNVHTRAHVTDGAITSIDTTNSHLPLRRAAFRTIEGVLSCL